MVKPQIDALQITETLGQYFGKAISGLAPIGTGQIASAYSFAVGGREYIVRFVTGMMATSFDKDRFAFNRLPPAGVPVPPIIHIGIFNDFHFAISPKVPGVPLDALSDEENLRLAPGLMETLDLIHSVDISDTEGYGYFDGDGVGLYKGWREYLPSVADEESDDEFYGKWYHMFDDTFLDRELFERVYERMSALLKYCPEERYLVHADYAFGNVLAHDGEITAVLDWANAMYGDFLFDVAFLDLGYPDFQYRARFRRFYEERSRATPHFEERVLCYKFYISLDSQKWYAMSGNTHDNERMRKLTLRMLDDGPVG